MPSFRWTFFTKSSGKTLSPSFLESSRYRGPSYNSFPHLRCLLGKGSSVLYWQEQAFIEQALLLSTIALGIPKIVKLGSSLEVVHSINHLSLYYPLNRVIALEMFRWRSCFSVSHSESIYFETNLTESLVWGRLVLVQFGHNLQWYGHSNWSAITCPKSLPHSRSDVYFSSPFL